MRLHGLLVIGLLAVGCGYDPQQTYSSALPDASADGPSEDALPLVRLDAGQGPDVGRDGASDATGLRDALPDTTVPKLEAGPELQVRLDAIVGQDARSDLFVAHPDLGEDLGPDMGPDLLGTDLPTEAPTPDASAPETSAPDSVVGLDTLAQCTCTLVSRPYCVTCVNGIAYQAGLTVPVFNGECQPRVNSWFCASGCVANYECPDATPYCITATGQCSVTRGLN